MSDHTIIISSSIVVAGWFINNFLSRRHEISKKRMDYRLESLLSFLPVFLSITSSPQPFIDDKKLNDKIINARVNFQLYGLQDELDLFNEFVLTIEKQDTKEATITINKLIDLVRGRLRNELKLPSLKL